MAGMIVAVLFFVGVVAALAYATMDRGPSVTEMLSGTKPSGWTASTYDPTAVTVAPVDLSTVRVVRVDLSFENVVSLVLKFTGASLLVGVALGIVLGLLGGVFGLWD